MLLLRWSSKAKDFADFSSSCNWEKINFSLACLSSVAGVMGFPNGSGILSVVWALYNFSNFSFLSKDVFLWFGSSNVKLRVQSGTYLKST